MPDETSPFDTVVPHRTVYTLGPAGIDADAEATHPLPAVAVAPAPPAPTFEEAVRLTHVAPLLRVNLHIRNMSRMNVVGVWESPTKQMSLATRSADLGLDAARSVALHPATDARPRLDQTGRAAGADS